MSTVEDEFEMVVGREKRKRRLSQEGWHGNGSETEP
jgi:hypothetical protein